MIVITMSCQSQYVRMFDGVSLKCMLTWHTDYLENKNLALHFADPWVKGCHQVTEFTVGEGGLRRLSS